jgi:hypothetical protein
MDQTGENCQIKSLIQRLENMECQLHKLTEQQCFIQTKQECILRFMNDLADSQHRFMNDLAGKAGNSQRVSHTPVSPHGSQHGSQHGSTTTPVARLHSRSNSACMPNFLPHPLSRPKSAPTSRPAAPHDNEVVASVFVAAVIPPKDATVHNHVSTSPHARRMETKPLHSHEGRSARSPALYARLGDGLGRMETEPENARMCSIYDP